MITYLSRVLELMFLCNIEIFPMVFIEPVSHYMHYMRILA